MKKVSFNEEKSQNCQNHAESDKLLSKQNSSVSSQSEKAGSKKLKPMRNVSDVLPFDFDINSHQVDEHMDLPTQPKRSSLKGLSILQFMIDSQQTRATSVSIS